MRTADLARMSVQALAKNNARTLLTTLGIVIGIAAVIAMVSLGQGAQALVDQQMQSMGTNVIYVMPNSQRGPGGARGPSDDNAALTDEDLEAIRNEVPTVSAASPVVNASGQIVFGNQNWSSRVEGVNESYLQIRDWSIAEGEFFGDADVKAAARIVVVGKTVVDNVF